jgi:hypothetical protein
MPDVFGYHPTEPTQVEHDLDVLMQEYLRGAIWTQTGLGMKSRIVCSLAARVVKGQYDTRGESKKVKFMNSFTFSRQTASFESWSLARN